MRRGTILYFTQNGLVAHIWCAEAGNPLFRAQEDRFRDLWPTLAVGTVVTFEAEDQAGTQDVVTLDLASDDGE